MKPFLRKAPLRFLGSMKHDLSIGFTASRSVYFATLLCTVVLCALFLENINTANHIIEVETGAPQGAVRFSVFDMLVYTTSGIGRYVPTTEHSFILPIQWLVFQILIAVIVAYYPSSDLRTYAPQVFTRMQGVRLWWISKCLWVLFSVIAFYLLVLVVLVGCTFLFGDPSAPWAPDRVSLLIDGFDLAGVAQGKVALALLVTPALSVALSLVQVALSIIIGPSMSFITLMAYYVSSIFYNSNLLVGDYSMLARSDLITFEGTDAITAFIVCTTVSAAAIVIGGLALGKRDLF